MERARVSVGKATLPSDFSGTLVGYLLMGRGLTGGLRSGVEEIAIRRPIWGMDSTNKDGGCDHRH